MINELRKGIETGFIDGSVVSDEAYRPQFVSNNYKEGKKVLSSIEDELLACDEFQISVAFITMSGITPLLQTLKELEKRNIQGKILTTNYLSFSEPRALEKLESLSNITLKMYDVEKAGFGFHTKGYIFKKSEIYRIIIGSSNITGSALTSNYEWNTKIVSTNNGEVTKDILNEFQELWNSEYSLSFDRFIEEYKERYSIIKHQREIARQEKEISFEKYKLQPNSMQVGFISNLKKIVEAGEKKALLISATGTGKTFASAFAMRELGFKKILFVVHRNQIARQAKASFERVFGKTLTTGFVSGSRRDYKADIIFATVQTISKPEVLKEIPEDYFTACIYDEAHHSSAESFRRVMDHFKTAFMLGMTATPDKRDDNIINKNIYELYDHNIAYEIRLQQAMEEDLLCPFHYFGISDLTLISDDGQTTEEKTENFKLLTSDERVKNVVLQADYFGYSGDRVKGLIFCSRIEEARELSRKFNSLGLKTIALAGDDNENTRSDAIELLTKDLSEEALDNCYRNENNIVVYPGEEYLDYIITVDIFSEGTDIVEVNQVIMLRPTQSPIVFIQQLGRGLRKASNKEYVVILDFIGNYKNNFMIPIALSGDRTYNKDNYRRFLMEGERVLPGASTVHFDEISKKKIFESVDNANFNDIKLIRENYTNLKNKLGRIPSLKDFDDFGEMDVLRIFDNASLGSYYKFLRKYEKELYKVKLSDEEEIIVEFISKKLAAGKRIHELQMLKRIMLYSKGIAKEGLFKGLAKDLMEYGKIIDSDCKDNIVNYLTNEFPTKTGRATYEKCVFIEKAMDDYRPTEQYLKMLLNKDFYDIVDELIDFGIYRYRKNYSNSYKKTDFVLYQKYTYEDVCHLLNWEHNEVPLNIGGYKFDKKTKTFPVFINYEKAEDITATTKYEDHFTSNKTLIAISKSNRSMKSEDVQNFIYAQDRGIEVELFVRKNKDDKISKEFYYLGHMIASGKTKEFVMDNTDSTAVEIEWILDNPVREDLYEYIINA